MKRVTVVIPVYNLDTYRLNNLFFILPLLVPRYNVCIIEQINKSNTHNILKLPKKFNINHIRHIKLTNSSNIIHKTWLINKSCNFVSTPFIWVIDCDFYMNFKTFILDNDILDRYDWIQPYNYARSLSENETKQLHDNGELTIQYYGHLQDKHRHVNFYGALSYIFNVVAYQQLGGMDENYIGWGYEDYDIFLTLHNKIPNNPVYINRSHCGMHQWHPTSEKNIEGQANRNLMLFANKGYNLKQVNKMLKQHYYKEWVFNDID